MALQVTALYAALLGLIGMVLGGLVGRVRSRTNISLHDGGKPELIEANRRHMNWVENVPFILLLLAIIELNGGSRTWLHIMGVTLLVARILHPFGISTEKMLMPQRLIGAAGTVIVTACAILTLLWQVLGR